MLLQDDAARFSCLTLSLYPLEVGWFLYPLVLFLWPIASVYAVLYMDVFHYYSILSSIPIDCSLTMLVAVGQG